MSVKNKMKISFLSISENEAFARSVVACFVLNLNPSISQLSDIKTAVSEAVTNAIVHGYEKKLGEIQIECELEDNKIHINIIDFGVGIKNIEDALEPFYTTKESEERSGMGFTIMKSFMDDVKVFSEIGKGTKISMTKTINKNV
jgi:stage II sporulation protein AB (anti-sigma F factor)